ncbi:F-actin-uncapping protein LRRC16A isoform X5 [Bombus vosnesenskii]|uniref:F-actin-uncapping protein LRRC16A isoform X5 n=2 Tax=Pyrobombus TaxID=144703 RepID=A0A6J3K7N3_9HYME|nr:F-actin-uncapping protein LRRC16A isoform X4 [Bombus impatiens]XP_033349073.1 F-actin-uncapping protein LRRC16A isoform X5 [Bombus vosnesenskii]XP_050470300.1 F-actin-uncapping protein LRRC16A isoform X4 [Bombus huntii]
MSTRSQLTKDLNESVKALLGKHVKILLKNVVKLETKQDKQENRVLVFSPCRLFLLTAKVPTRIDCHFHYLEITSIESKRANQLSLSVGERYYNFTTTGAGADTTEVDAMIEALHTAIRNIFPTVPLNYIIRKIEVIPASRLQSIRGSELARSTEATRHTGPCGGFSTQYACMCDLHGVPYREEVAWDVDTIYLSHDTRELNLRDFDHLDQKDLVPIISALEYNTWFTKLRASHLKLSHEPLERLLHVMRRSLSIQELYLDNLGIKWDFAHKLSLALISNANTMLQTIDLSYNTIEDKGASSLCGIIAKLQGGAHLSGPIGKLPKGLQKLNLAHCGLTGKGISQIAHALSLNRSMPTSLQYLNLSENSLKDDINNLCNFLAQPNSLTHLDLSGTDTTLECLFGALLRGCATNLVHLNVARNSFSSKKTKEIPPSFKQFFTATLSLKYLNISCCKLPLEALKHLLLGLACNESTVGLELDMSGNNLGSMGAHVLESCIHGVRCIASLDISDSNMDVDLAQVITAIGKNKSIKQLYMGRNTVSMKSKHIAVVMDALVQMLQEDDCVLQALHLPDSRLKSDLYNLINALGSNTCLHTLDISGNQIGDPGARLLAKALQINNHLRTIIYDKNNITLQGYADIVHALEKNCSVRHMPFPIYDLQPCMKTSAEKTEQLAKKIQDLLQRNVTPCKYSHGQAFRLQQGFLLSSTQQMVDRLVVQTQDTIKAIAAESCDANNDINYATGLIQDADNSKQLLPRLHEVLQRRDENNPIELKLHEMANELHKVVTIYLQDSLDAMIKCANEQCPTILSQTVIRGDESESVAVEDDLRSSCKEKNQISSEFIHTTITEQAGADIVNRVNELNLAVAAHVSDRITDEVIESLSRSYKNLIGDCDSRTRSSTPDVLRPSAGSMSSGSVIGVTSTVGVSTALPVGRTSIASEEDCPPETYSLVNSIGQCSSDQSPMKLDYLNLATPHLSNKRKSLHGRKLRPKSVVDSVEGLSADDIPDLLPSLPKSQAEAISETEHSLTESLDSVSELPNTVGQQLQHLVKSRPRRTKTRAPTRPMLRPDQPVDGLALGEGLDVFFRPTTPTTPLISPTSDDSSLHTFPTDGSPNLSLTSHKSIPPETDKKPGCSSPMLKTLLEPAPRSRSSDNLEKFSPLVGRRSQGDSPLTASPLTRRNTTDNAQNHERILTKSDSNKDTSNNVCNNCVGNTADTSKRSTLPIIGSGTSTRSLRDSDENSKVLQQTTATNSSDKDATAVPKDYETRKSLTKKSAVDTDKTANQPLPSLKLRSTGFDLRSPTNGSSTKSNSEVSKSPVLRSLTKGNSSLTDGKSNGALSKTKPVPPITAPKPRPWSMATDRKSGEFNLLSDGSSPNTSAGNTPDSGDALDESTDSGVSGPASLPPTLSASSTASSLSNASVEKRSVRELAASLNKSKTERKENGNGSAENG